MGNALEKRAMEVLELGAPYNEESGTDMLDDRFDVSASVFLTDTFRILDRARCIAVNISRGNFSSGISYPNHRINSW
jgi:hypothetical protein